MRVNGIELNVQLQGSGQPVVLLHGQGGNLNMWRPEIDHLSRSFQTVAIDFRGHGRSDRPAVYTWENHVDDVLGVMDALGLPSVFLVGISMGSTIAQGVATREPQRVSKLILVVPRPWGDGPPIPRFTSQQGRDPEAKSPDGTQRFGRLDVFAPMAGPEVREANAAFLREQAEEGLMLTRDQAMAASRAMGGRSGKGFDFRPLLPRVTARTLVISGRFDPLHSPEEGQEIADLIPGARLEVMERSGHLPIREEPERFLALIDEFLRD